MDIYSLKTAERLEKHFKKFKGLIENKVLNRLKDFQNTKWGYTPKDRATFWNMGLKEAAGKDVINYADYKADINNELINCFIYHFGLETQNYYEDEPFFQLINRALNAAVRNIFNSLSNYLVNVGNLHYDIEELKKHKQNYLELNEKKEHLLNTIIKQEFGNLPLGEVLDYENNDNDG